MRCIGQSPWVFGALQPYHSKRTPARPTSDSYQPELSSQDRPFGFPVPSGLRNKATVTE
jgi:hypothetical protein